MKFGPEKYFGAGNSKMTKFLEIFDPLGVILGVKGQFLGILWVKKVKNRGSPIFIKISPKKLFGVGNSKRRKLLESFVPWGFILGGQRSLLGRFEGQKSILTSNELFLTN